MQAPTAFGLMASRCYFRKYVKLGPGRPTKHECVKPWYLIMLNDWFASFCLLPKSNTQWLPSTIFQLLLI